MSLQDKTVLFSRGLQTKPLTISATRNVFTSYGLLVYTFRKYNGILKMGQRNPLSTECARSLIEQSDNLIELLSYCKITDSSRLVESL